MLSRKLLLGFVGSSLGLGLVLPVQAQQVLLTPAGTVMQSTPVGVPMLSSPAPGLEPKELIPFDGQYAVGSGVDGIAVIEPGTNVGVIFGGGTPSDPDIMVGGVRWSELLKLDKPDDPANRVKVAEMSKIGGVRYPTSGTQPTVVAASSTISIVNSPLQSTSIVRSLPDGTITTSPKNLNSSFIPVLLNNSDSPLSNSRILPGFNQ